VDPFTPPGTIAGNDLQVQVQSAVLQLHPGGSIRQPNRMPAGIPPLLPASAHPDDSADHFVGQD